MPPRSHFVIPILYAIKFPGGVPHALSAINEHDLRALPAAGALARIAALQKDFAEILLDKEWALKNRMDGLADGYQVRFFDTFEALGDDPHVFKVVFTDEPVPDHLVRPGSVFVALRTGAPGTPDKLPLEELTPELLKARLLAASAQLNQDDRRILDDLKNLPGQEAGYRRIVTDIAITEGFHNRPNIAVLESLRFSFPRRPAAAEFLPDEVHKQLRLLNHVRNHVARTLGRGPMPLAVDHVFTDLSCSVEPALDRSGTTEAGLRNRGVDDARALVDAIKYAERGTVGAAGTNPYIDEIDAERALLDGMIALAACAHAAPVIKLPVSNNTIFAQVKQVASAERGNGRKLNAMMRKLGAAFAPALAPWLDYVDEAPAAALKFVSNLPYEWAYHQGLPLMVRHEVSRIPVTPGYAAARTLLGSTNLHLALDDFREILFITSFADDDKIRDHLKSALEVLQGTDERADALLKTVGARIPGLPAVLPGTSNRFVPKIKWVEVANRAELIDALDRNTSPMVVFDFHGSHGQDGGGTLHLKDEAVPAFELCGAVRMPPIVVLSSCDTSPVDKGHESTASAFLLAGATTVLSSALPIKSGLAATFVVRLLERIGSYLPARVQANGTPVRWSTFVSGMIRRTYYYELVTLLRKERRFDKETKYELLLRIGLLLDPLARDWVAAVNREITSTLGIDMRYLEDFVAQHVQFLECMKYFQLGRPENIIVSARRAYFDE